MAFMLPVLRVVGAGLGAGAGLGVAEMITRKVGRKAREIDEDFGEGFERGMSGYYRKHISSAIEGLPADRDGGRAYDYLMSEYPQSKANQYEDEYEPEGGDGYDYVPNRSYERDPRRMSSTYDAFVDPRRDYVDEVNQFVKRKTGIRDYVKKHSTYDGVWQGGEGLGKGRKLMGDIRGAWEDLKKLKKDWQSYDPPEEFPDQSKKRKGAPEDRGADNLKRVIRAQASLGEELAHMRARRLRKHKRHLRSRAYRLGRRTRQNVGKRAKDRRKAYRQELGNI